MGPHSLIHVDYTFNENENLMAKLLVVRLQIQSRSVWRPTKCTSFISVLSQGNKAPGTPMPAGSCRLCCVLGPPLLGSLPVGMCWVQAQREGQRGHPSPAVPPQLASVKLEEKWLCTEVIAHHWAPHLLSATSFFRSPTRGSGHRSEQRYTGKPRALFCASAISSYKVLSFPWRKKDWSVYTI